MSPKPAINRPVHGRIRTRKKRQPEAEPTPRKPQKPATDTAPARRRRAADDADYEVGYGKPPKDKQFPPGQSGNPKGRPKKSKNLRSYARQIANEKVAVNTSGKTVRMPKIEALARKLFELAMKGNIQSLNKLESMLDNVADEFTTEKQPTAGEMSELDKLILEEYRNSLFGDQAGPDDVGPKHEGDDQ